MWRWDRRSAYCINRFNLFRQIFDRLQNFSHLPQAGSVGHADSHEETSWATRIPTSPPKSTLDHRIAGPVSSLAVTGPPARLEQAQPPKRNAGPLTPLPRHIFGGVPGGSRGVCGGVRSANQLKVTR
jgi:hypothetical protein